MVVGLTEKLRKKLKVTIDSESISIKGDVNCWHGHYLPWDRKACVVFVNNLTRYSVVLYGLKASDMKIIDVIFREQLRRNFIVDGIDIGAGESYIDAMGTIQYSKTSDRSILGTINDYFIYISWKIDDYITPFATDLDGLNRAANYNISLALDRVGLPSTPSFAMKEVIEKLW
ncbi:MAG: hypothetical protein CVU95_13560 [Firmicutes bacterium HGW-Firmicutes-2]|jgi:hypothetical protein|nr:MAG: hypothetical protein CVU95_13560 [Firmicutes bacterium HGW-Firmicutes-2]